MSACGQCERLTRQLREAREEIAEYRRIGADVGRGSIWADQIAIVQLRLRVSAGVARMLLALLERAPRVVTREHLFAVMPHRGEDVFANVIGVQMCNLRRALRRHDLGAPIRTAHGVGFAIDALDALRLRAQLGLLDLDGAA